MATLKICDMKNTTFTGWLGPFLEKKAEYDQRVVFLKKAQEQVDKLHEESGEYWKKLWDDLSATGAIPPGFDHKEWAMHLRGEGDDRYLEINDAHTHSKEFITKLGELIFKEIKLE